MNLMNNLKKEIQIVKFNLATGEAKPGPLLAPILGQSQINIQTFCKEFNEMTAHLIEGVTLPIKIRKYEDKSFKIFYQAPTINYIYEQLVLHRTNRYIDNFRVITAYELLDILKILKSFYLVEKTELNIDLFYIKQILAFLGTKKVKVKKL